MLKNPFSTEVSRIIKAPRKAIYNAFLDPNAIAKWLPPANMKGHVHTFEPYEGGTIRMSLTYNDVNESPNKKGGKSSADTDTFQGKIVELIPHDKVVWATEFDSNEPEFAGIMTLTWRFVDVDGGTRVTVLCENIPSGIRLEDNEAGSKSSLQQLAAFLE